MPGNIRHPTPQIYHFFIKKNFFYYFFSPTTKKIENYDAGYTKKVPDDSETSLLIYKGCIKAHRSQQAPLQENRISQLSESQHALLESEETSMLDQMIPYPSLGSL